MSGFAKIWAWEQRGLSPTEKCVLMGLADFHTENGGCFPSLKRVAELVNVSIDTVHRTIDKLIEKGLVRKQSRQKENGGNNSNLYDLLFTDIKVPYPQNADTPTRKMRHEQQDLEQYSVPTEREDPVLLIFGNHEEPPIDPEKEFWDQAVGMLMGMGLVKRTAQSFTGRCLKMADKDLDKVLHAINEAVDAGVTDPIPYVTTILSGKRKLRKVIQDQKVAEAFAELEAASERRKAEWREKYGTEYGILPDTGTGGAENNKLLQHEPHQGFEGVQQERSGGAIKVSSRRTAQVVRPSIGNIGEGTFRPNHSGYGGGSGKVIEAWQ